MRLWSKTRKFHVSYLTKSYQPIKTTPYVPEYDLHKLVLSVEEVTMTFALLTLLHFYFSKNGSSMFNNSHSPKSLNSNIIGTECKQIWDVLQQISNSTAMLFPKILSRYSFLYNQMLSGHIFNSLH